MKKSHSLWAESGRNPSGEPVDEPEHQWASLHIKFTQSIIRRGQGRFRPQLARLGAWNSGTLDAGAAAVGASTAGIPDTPPAATGP